MRPEFVGDEINKPSVQKRAKNSGVATGPIIISAISESNSSTILKLVNVSNSSGRKDLSISSDR